MSTPDGYIFPVTIVAPGGESAQQDDGPLVLDGSTTLPLLPPGTYTVPVQVSTFDTDSTTFNLSIFVSVAFTLVIGLKYFADTIVRGLGGVPLGKSITWSSADPSICEITPDGHVTPIAPGKVLITASVHSGPRLVTREEHTEVGGIPLLREFASVTDSVAIEFSTQIDETISAVSALYEGQLATPTDIIEVSDALVIGFGLNRDDAIAIVDADPIKDYTFSFLDASTMADGFGGTSERTLTDSLGSFDTAVVVPNKGIEDVLVTSDTMRYELSFNLFDILTPTISPSTGNTARVDDVATTSETRSFAAVTTLKDSFTFTETLARDFATALNDLLTSQDAVTSDTNRMVTTVFSDADYAPDYTETVLGEVVYTSDIMRLQFNGNK